MNIEDTGIKFVNWWDSYQETNPKAKKTEIAEDAFTAGAESQGEVIKDLKKDLAFILDEYCEHVDIKKSLVIKHGLDV